MYERFYNLRERPFALSPDPEYLYLSKGHREALDSIRYGIESRAGFIVVTGEIGAGKTTLLQTLLQRVDDRTVVARVVNTMLEPRELVESIALEFGLPDASRSKPALLRDLGAFLVQQRTQGRRPLLVIDEAQNLTSAALEEVRLLSNLETEKSKLLQILLAGQPNLRDKIASPELEQFRQRIAVSYHLKPLDAAETAAYINYRLEHAAIGEPPRFSPDAAALVHDVSAGVPRIINVVCDATLVFGYAEERRSIDGPMLEEVIEELLETGIITRSARSARPATQPAVQPSRGVDSAPLATSAAPFAARPVPAAPLAPAPVSAVPIAAATIAAVPTPAIEAPVPAKSPLDQTIFAAAQVPAAPEPQPDRERSLAAAREAVMQARQIAAARDSEMEAARALMERRRAELAVKEQALLERERQMAEQRRILGEEYRLLRRTPASRQPGATAGVAVATGRAGVRPVPVRPIPGAPRPPVSPAPRYGALPFWQRIVRYLRSFTGAHAVRS